MELKRKAPDWQVQKWFNTAVPLSLEKLRGRVVVLHAFQMLCPGCVQHGLPQAVRIHQHFAAEQVQVVGLHSVFEHHEVMTPAALSAFIHEYRWPFPIAVDQPDMASNIPLTMQTYGLKGTPSLVLIDSQGNIRYNIFGQASDMAVAAAIMSLVNETSSLHGPSNKSEDDQPGCSDSTCAIDPKTER
ncbi:MAG: peroxiredoxin family protein [Oceanococcus sp.]